MVQIKQMIVSKSIQNRLTYGGKNPVKYIMIHQTANTSKGANAYMHAKLQANGNSRQASWHYQVDADNIYQSFPDTAQAWHAGNRYYNQNSIGIELTVNSDGNYIGTVEHGAELVKYLMNKHNVPISNVIRHKDASGKYCPRELLDGKNGITWAKFKQMVQGASTPKPAPSKPSKPATPSKPSGGSIVDYLNSQGKDSSFSARKKLANQYGIKNYKGTAKQNIDLLNKLKSGSKPTTSKPSTSTKNVTNYKGSSIVDYLNLKENKHLGGSSFSNRKKLASANGIKNYTGTATQNKQLLDKLQGGGASSKSTSKSVKVGDTVTTKALYANSGSTKNVRSSSIKGYVDTINNNWRNPIRLRNKKGGYYLGFTRQQDLV